MNKKEKLVKNIFNRQVQRNPYISSKKKSFYIQPVYKSEFICKFALIKKCGECLKYLIYVPI